MTSWGLLLAITCALALIARSALQFQGVPRIIFLAQVAFWAMSYLLRPAILLTVNPAPGFADYLADPRLAPDGYEVSLRPVLKIVLAGLLAYAFAVFLLAKRLSKTVGRISDRPPTWGTTFGLAYVVGYAFRLVWLERPDLAIAGLLGSLATVSAFAYLTTSSPRQPVSRIFMGVLIVGELTWSVAFTSKTPAIAIGLALAVRFAADRGWRRLATSTIVAAFTFYFAFAVVQSLKNTAYENNNFQSADSRYPIETRPLLPVARRFDLVSGVVDGMYAHEHQWMPPGRLITTLAASVVPSPVSGIEKQSAGTRWATEVSAPSRGMSRLDVSLAEGAIGEGYAIGGYSGVVVLSILLSLVTLGAAKWLTSKKLFAAATGAYMLSNAVLFERGLLGGTEHLVRAIELAAAVVVISKLVRSRTIEPAVSQ